MRKISYFWWGGFLLALILSGCGKLERKGPEPVNIPPQVFFANIPPESTKFSISPRVYWYGTDKDGFITAFQYAVITDSLIRFWGGGEVDLDGAKDSLKRIGPDSTDWVNITDRLDVFGVHVPAEGGNQGNVKLYAALVESVYTPQHVFLRAVDNRSGISEIKTQMFWRNNHAPQCTLEVDTSFVHTNFYCLPETTQTWKGIGISWVGLDTLDYPDKRKQPDFYFRWELWGPYKDTLDLTDPIATKVFYSLDSIEVGGEWIRDEWTLDKSHTFKNLENYPGRGYGWYQFKVWSRDDAFVSSKEPASTFIRILKPLFRYADSGRKTILVLDVTKYGQAGGARISTDVWPFYYSALSKLTQEDICDGFNIFSLGEQLPNEDSLSRYDLVILLNLGPDAGILEKSYVKYKEYMDVGGFLWIIGMNNYGAGGSRGDHDLVVDIKAGNPYTYEVATEYMGVDGLFYPQYAAAFPLTLEFIAADPFGSWEFPRLDMDTVEVKKLEGYAPSDTGLDFRDNGIPHVPYDHLVSSLDFAGRAPLDRRVYSFVSRFGRESPMEQMPCATTYIGPTYRTAEFAFPLNLMKVGDDENPGAQEVFKRIVEWFWLGI
jgi:hypothetical protein